VQTNANQEMNNLLALALRLERCEGCPNKIRVKKYCKQGIYPRWGAGSINAPIVLILERPGNQGFLCETGQTNEILASNIPAFRKNFTEIMFTGYEDGVRYLEAILEFLFGDKAREMSFLSRIDILSKTIYITELIKCPGKIKGKENVVNKTCPERYLNKEWELISNQLQRPILAIIASRLNSKGIFPSNFPAKIITINAGDSFTEKGISYLNVYHPAYFNQPGKWKDVEPEFTVHAQTHEIPLQTDLGVSIGMKKTAYLFYLLETMNKGNLIREKILKRI